jgi:hypothetical protein
MVIGPSSRFSTRREVFREHSRKSLIDRGRVIRSRGKMLGVESKVVEHGIVLVDSFLELDKVGQIVCNLRMPGDDMTSDEFCCLEWLVADRASALFGVINADVRLDDAFVWRIAV